MVTRTPPHEAVSTFGTMETAAAATPMTAPSHEVVSTPARSIGLEPAEQDVRRDRQGDEEIDRGEVAARRIEPREPHDAGGKQREENVDPPTLRQRIGAVDEIGKALVHEGPAGAYGSGRSGVARQASRSAPVQTASIRRNLMTGGTSQAISRQLTSGQRDVEGARKQIGAEPADRPARYTRAAAADRREHSRT